MVCVLECSTGGVWFGVDIWGIGSRGIGNPRLVCLSVDVCYQLAFGVSSSYEHNKCSSRKKCPGKSVSGQAETVAAPSQAAPRPFCPGHSFLKSII